MLLRVRAVSCASEQASSVKRGWPMSTVELVSEAVRKFLCRRADLKFRFSRWSRAVAFGLRVCVYAFAVSVLSFESMLLRKREPERRRRGDANRADWRGTASGRL